VINNFPLCFTGVTKSLTDEPASSPTAHYLPQLDGLRALAIGAVLMEHLSPEDSPVRSWGLGRFGVRLFFVLSGFLITGILLRLRARVRANGLPWRSAVGQFYFRRTLRIFPIYYLTLVVAALLNVESVRETFWWHFFYASNWLLAAEVGWNTPMTHFWSLAVEEQFYLVWPWLVIFLPEAALGPVFLGCILLGPLSRLVMGWWGFNAVALDIVTPSCMDSLGLGALLALGWARSVSTLWPLRGCLAVGLLLLLLIRPVHEGTTPIRGQAALDTAIALVCVWAVDRAARGFTGPVGKLLASWPSRSLGKISYGTYVYHNFVPGMATYVLPLLGAEWITGWWCCLLLVAISIALAALSWTLIEGPLARLKNRVSKG
jgi:peptidoglycan/LPS O-acetylase OafA/YrhL